MNDPKVNNAFHNLQDLSNGICSDVDALMGEFSEWASNLEENIEKGNEEFSTFLLPRAPKQRQTCRRKARNIQNSTSVINSTSNISSTSIINSTSVTSSTLLQNETSDLDEAISRRTRNARRAAASKMSMLNITKSTNLEESKQEIATEKSSTGNTSGVTSVMSKASKRIKPVLKVKQTVAVVPEPEKNEIPVPAAAGSENISRQQKKVSRIEPDRPSRNKKSTTPAELLSQKERLSDEKTLIYGTPIKRLSRRKTSETLSDGAVELSSTGKVSRTLSEGPVVGRRGSSWRNQSKTPTEEPKGSKSSAKGRSISASPRTRSTGSKRSQEQKAKTPEVDRGSLGDKTVTIKKVLTSTFILPRGAGADSDSDNERTPVGFERLFSKSIVCTPVTDLEKTPIAEEQNATFRENQNIEPKGVSETAAITEVSVNETEEAVGGSQVPKKKRKVKSQEKEVKQNIQEPQEMMRITRTKSKAIKQMMEENQTKQAELSSLAKKVLNKAKMTSVKKTQLAALQECNSFTPGRVGNGLPFGNLTASKSKYHLLLSNSKKLKIPSGQVSVLKASADKRPTKPKIPNGDANSENLVRTAAKPPKNDLEKEVKLNSRMKKEEEAALKRQNVIKNKQEELRRKNELKHQLALKQREKLEQEKYHNMIQSEKEKEERHKLILKERQAKVKEEAQKRKMLTQQKIAETLERRRMEEEARIAKLKEMEAEEQRLALEKQKEQERQERRAQERLAQKKAREEYDMQMKQELEAERLKAKKWPPSTSKMPSACKRQRFGIVGEKRDWDYKPRNENDYGLEDEHSEIDSEDEKTYSKTKPVAPWAKRILDGKSSPIKVLTLEMISEFMPCSQKSPDIYKMFKMTPSKRIKRSSSAIWNTPSS